MLGVRFDHSRAISQDLHALDSQGRDTDAIVAGLGTLYTWNIVSPRLGVTMKLSADGRTMLRASYGRFSQGVLTGEFGSFHPGVTPGHDGGTSRRRLAAIRRSSQWWIRRASSSSILRSARRFRTSTPIGVDREVGRQLAVTMAYVRKDGADFIGWTELGGQYSQQTRPLPDGTSVPVLVLVNATADRRFR